MHHIQKRPLWKRATNRRAVSTVISTVLMTSLAIMMGTLVVFWASQTLGNYQGSAGVFFTQRGNALKESFVIEDIWFTKNAQGNPYRVDVTIRNVGAIDLKIVAIYLNGTAHSIPAQNGTITVGQSKALALIFAPITDHNAVYFFIIATERGNKVTEFWKVSNN